MEDNNREIAIKVSNVKKKYKLGQIGGGTLKADVESWWAKVRGKEDPNSIIGDDKRSNGTVFMALNGVSFTIYKGEAIGIIGSNGAGKSTLLKILSRVTAPTEGEIDLYGRITSMLEVGTGFNGELTGRENVYMNGAILGMTKDEIDAKMEQIIEFSEVGEFIDTPVKRYSSGMFVKLAFSVAAHLDSEIMIMDEVLAVGDMAFQKKCLEKMCDAAKTEGKTVLYVSHNMSTIRRLCDRCIVLDKGKLIMDGSVEEAISLYMSNNNDSRISYDYTDLPRAKNESRKIQMLGLDILNRKENRIIRGEPLEVNLHCKANSDCEDLKIRFEMFYADGSVIGTFFLDYSLNKKEGDIFDLIIKFDTNNIPEGRYYGVALVYEFDFVGNQIGVDRVEPAVSFEIFEKNNELIWLHQYWGHVKFNDIELLDDVNLKCKD